MMVQWTAASSSQEDPQHLRPARQAPVKAAAVASVATMSVGHQAEGVTLHPLDLEEFPGATVRSLWTGEVTADQDRAWIAHAHVPGMICLTAGPEETTLLQHQDDPGDLGALMMMSGAEGEHQEVEEEEEEEEGEEAFLTNLPCIQNTSQDRNQDQGGMIHTLTKVLAVAPVWSSKLSSRETNSDLSANVHNSFALLSGFG